MNFNDLFGFFFELLLKEFFSKRVYLLNICGRSRPNLWNWFRFFIEISIRTSRQMNI